VAQFDVLVTPNLYGSLVQNVVAGLLGSPGVVPGASVGTHGAMFEPGARHVALELAGKNSVNPTAMLLSSVLMLRYLRLPNFADRIERAVFNTYVEGTKTADVGGTATTSQFVDAVIAQVRATGGRKQHNVAPPPTFYPYSTPSPVAWRRRWRRS